MVVAEPPYTEWRSIYRFHFPHNGPCIGLIDGKLITCSRAFFEDPGTPLNSDLCRRRVRGLIFGVFDVDAAMWRPALTMAHHRGPRGEGDPDVCDDQKLNFPDISYAWMTDLGKGKFAVIYHEGYKGPPCDIRLAIMQL